MWTPLCWPLGHEGYVNAAQFSPDGTRVVTIGTGNALRFQPVVLGRDFRLDAELAARIERIPGVTAVRLSAATPPRLALVG